MSITLSALRMSLAIVLLAVSSASAVPRPVADSSVEVLPASDGFVFKENITYGVVGGESLVLDVYQPDTPGVYPAVIEAHGGGFVGGSRGGAGELGKVLARLGYVFFAIDYRLAPKHRFPAGVSDVQGAVRWVREHASEYGVDPDRIALMGDSAGGNLAALAGLSAVTSSPVAPWQPSTGEPTTSVRVKAIVSLWGPMDFEYSKSGPTGPRELDGVLENYLGGTCSQMPDACKAASPIRYVSAKAPPTLLIHGTADTVVSVEHAKRTHQALKAVGADVTYVPVEGAVHGFDIVGDPKYQKALDAVKTFLAAKLTASAPKPRTRTAVGRPVTFNTVACRRYFNVSGSIESTHAASTSVRLDFYRRVDGRWVRQGSSTATVAAGKTTYRGRYRVVSPGQWCVSAYHADSDHLPTSSARRYFAAATEVTRKGVLSKSEVWSGAVYVSDRLIVPKGVTLTVRPGTLVSLKARANYKDTSRGGINVQGGTLKAVGTPNSQIWFTSAASSPCNGDSGGISMTDGVGCVVKYAIVEFGTLGIELVRTNAAISHSIIRWTNSEGVYSEQSSPIFEHNRMYGNAYHEIALEHGNKNVILDGNSFGPGNAAINFQQTSAWVAGNHFHDYRETAMTVYIDSQVEGLSNRFERIGADPPVGVEDGSTCTLVGSDYGTGTVSPPALDFGDPRPYELDYIPGDPEDRFAYVYAAEDQSRRAVKRLGKGLSFGWALAYADGYIWKLDTGRLTRVDTETGTYTVFNQSASDTVRLRPKGLTHDGEDFWVADDTSIRRLELSDNTFHVAQSFDIPEKEKGYRGGITCDGTYLYLVSADHTKIEKLDKSGSVVSTVAVPAGIAGAFVWTGSHFWSAAGDKLTKYSADGKLVGEIFPVAEETFALAWDGSHLWTLQRTCERWDDDKIFKVEILDDALRRTATLSRPVVPARVTAGRSFLVRGTIAPSHTSTATLEMHVYRLVKGRWTLHRRMTTSVVAGATAYSVRLTVPTAGRWYVTARHRDDKHLSSSSPRMYFIAR